MTNERRRLWDRLDTPVKVVGAVVAILVAGVTTYFLVRDKVSSPNPTDVAAATSPAAVAARQIKKCMAHHGMRAPRVTSGQLLDRRLVFKRCDWLPLVSTSSDG